MKINRRNGGDGIHAQMLRICRQFGAVPRVVASDMGYDRQLSADFLHDGLQSFLALLDTVIDAFARGAAYIQPLNALVRQIAGEFFVLLNAYFSVRIIAGVECRDDSFEFIDSAHDITTLFLFYGRSSVRY